MKSRWRPFATRGRRRRCRSHSWIPGAETLRCCCGGSSMPCISCWLVGRISMIYNRLPTGHRRVLAGCSTLELYARTLLHFTYTSSSSSFIMSITREIYSGALSTPSDCCFSAGCQSRALASRCFLEAAEANSCPAPASNTS